jgi:hypothetical protein
LVSHLEDTGARNEQFNRPLSSVLEDSLGLSKKEKKMGEEEIIVGVNK